MAIPPSPRVASASSDSRTNARSENFTHTDCQYMNGFSTFYHIVITRRAPTLVQIDVAHTDTKNDKNSTFATPHRGKRSRNLADELSSPVLPRQT